ncbi:RcnB family protein [Rhodoferax ferrireducens]|uniref:RcnB family protein n=1 Tax=Rhodoferax ferrireducens TaxID=192843 RepID=UPI00298D8A83|nr:RcnB family protein [Rhodoferax ferrireducens]WPC68661.1 RcnB family protein [Rhodoferax ferrireducens]
MKSTAIVFAIAAASLGFSAIASAQGNGRHGMREEPVRIQETDPRHADQRDQRRYNRHDERRTEQRYYRQDDHRFDQGEVRRNDRNGYYSARGPDFRRGGYIPREYRNHQYVVTDYRSYHLSPPPYGQQWVQVGPDYVLIAIATGLIAHIILSN